MAARAKKKTGGAVGFPDCPVCLSTLFPPIYLCHSGHSLCGPCTAELHPPKCPLCQQFMTQMRNRTLEDLINKAKVPCPYRPAGCPLSPENASVADHVQECHFRTLDCPIAAGLGRCSWTGPVKYMLDHVRGKHPSAFKVGLEADIELEGITLRECDYRVYLAAQHQKLLFIISAKMDSIRRNAYWTVQLIGSKQQAHQHHYEIHLSSRLDAQRKVVFAERCASDALSTDNIFRESACVVLPFDLLAHYTKDDKLCFRYCIRKNIPKYKGESGEIANDNLRSPEGVNDSRGPDKSPGQNGPGPSKSSDMAA